MPLYEYECGRCGRFEVIRKFADVPLAQCPTCGGEIHKLPSAPAIQFKGTGWYVTDYARKGKGGKADGGQAGGGESKPASTSSAKEAPASSSPSKVSGTKDSGAKDSSSSPATKSAAGS